MSQKNIIDSDPHEVEYKFAVKSVDDLSRLKNAFMALSPRVRRERNYETEMQYFDTPDFALHKTGTVLRTMDECKPLFTAEVQIKTTGTVDAAGCLDRLEFSYTLPCNGLDLSVVADDAAKTLLTPAQGKKLSPVFNTVTKRNDISLFLDVCGKVACVELALDEKVEFRDAATGAVFLNVLECELEYKQKYADPSIKQEDIFALMRHVRSVLEKVAHLTPVNEGRAETGFKKIITLRGL